jgi:hypothetical protein
MKSFILAALLLLLSAASPAQTPPAAAPQGTSDATTRANTPPGSDASHKPAPAKAPGNSCRKAAFGTCKGCSITCGEGEKAVCGDVLYSWDSNRCIRDAVCRCKAKRS